MFASNKASRNRSAVGRIAGELGRRQRAAAQVSADDAHQRARRLLGGRAVAAPLVAPRQLRLAELLGVPMALLVGAGLAFGVVGVAVTAGFAFGRVAPRSPGKALASGGRRSGAAFGPVAGNTLTIGAENRRRRAR